MSVLTDGAFIVKDAGSLRMGHIDEPSRTVKAPVQALDWLSTLMAADPGSKSLEAPGVRQLDAACRELGIISDQGSEPLRDVLIEMTGSHFAAWPRLRDNAAFWAAVDIVKEHTLTSPASMSATWSAVVHLDTRRIPGAIVECGVWRGGSALLMYMAGRKQRDFYLYDTFDWSWPGKVEFDGLAMAPGADYSPQAHEHMGRGVSATEVEEWLLSHGLQAEALRLIVGDVHETLARDRPDSIALLRLDTDFYSSTRVELDVLYPRVVSGGILIVDDYGKHTGVTRAVDEYFADQAEVPFLTAVGPNQGVIGVKP